MSKLNEHLYGLYKIREIKLNKITNMPKFIKAKTVKPEQITIGNSIEVHADSLATFKAYVSKANKGKDNLIRFNYSPFVGSFCTATRKKDEPRKV